MGDIKDLLDGVEFVSKPCTVLENAMSDYHASQPRLLRESDNYGVQQAALWALLGDEIVGHERYKTGCIIRLLNPVFLID